jgi:hypothetical protein
LPAINDINIGTYGASHFGLLDEFRLWNDERGLTEIQGNMCTAPCSNEGLIAYYKFDGGSGQDVLDENGIYHAVLGSKDRPDKYDPCWANDPDCPATVDCNYMAENLPPIANDDSYTVTNVHGLLNTSDSDGVLANDTDPDGPDDQLTAQLESGPLTGKLLAFNSDGSFMFTCDSDGDGFCDASGSTSFIYRAYDDCGDWDYATVQITIDADVPIDNCPGNYNLDVDKNGDRIPDAQSDIDGDGLGVPCDNCPDAANYNGSGTCVYTDQQGNVDHVGADCNTNNPCAVQLGYTVYCSMNQEDTDGDGLGDACDENTDQIFSAVTDTVPGTDCYQAGTGPWYTAYFTCDRIETIRPDCLNVRWTIADAQGIRLRMNEKFPPSRGDPTDVVTIDGSFQVTCNLAEYVEINDLILRCPQADPCTVFATYVNRRQNSEGTLFTGKIRSSPAPLCVVGPALSVAEAECDFHPQRWDARWSVDNGNPICLTLSGIDLSKADTSSVTLNGKDVATIPCPLDPEPYCPSPNSVCLDAYAAFDALGFTPVPGKTVYVRVGGSFTKGNVDKYYSQCPAEIYGNDACSHGYWKTHAESWDRTGYAPSTSFAKVFGYSPISGLTLMQALEIVGGGTNQLLRDGTAALLSAAHPDVFYPLLAAVVREWVGSALASGDPAEIAEAGAELGGYNKTLSCPIY